MKEKEMIKKDNIPGIGCKKLEYKWVNETPTCYGLVCKHEDCEIYKDCEYNKYHFHKPRKNGIET